MKNSMIIVMVLVVLLGSLALIMAFDSENSRENLPYTHSFTKAVCNEENFCEDYVVTCKNKSIVDFRPTGFSVQFPENWEDMRSMENKSRLC